ncbi:MAG: peptidoglycan DD-metalloendopeptidase family protein [Rhodospirillaceae bacterium]|nr:peptidoglycan DD-metalloendopeptidase family protein [Rhodospirillaceae bacterium]
MRRSPAAPGRVLAALAVGTSLYCAPAFAEAPPSHKTERKADPRDLKEVEARIKREREAAAALAKRTALIRDEIKALREKLVKGAAATQNRETALTRQETELRVLEAREKAAAADFHARQKQLAEILAALQRLSLRPPVTLASRSDDANDAVRSALLLRSLIPELERRVERLRLEIAAYTRLKEAVRMRRTGVANADSALSRERQALLGLIEQKQALLRESEQEQEANQARIAALTAEAENLRDLLAKLRQEKATRKPGPPPRAATLTEPDRGKIRSFAGARGRLTLPAAGDIAPRFGPEEKFGELSKGLMITARPGAQAVAPFDGQVVFAGPFRGYGRILIIEHRDGYHSLIVGLARIDASVKQWVLAGEPVGIVGERDGQSAQLYVEIRHNGRPIDPAHWFRPRHS